MKDTVVGRLAFTLSLPPPQGIESRAKLTLFFQEKGLLTFSGVSAAGANVVIIHSPNQLRSKVKMKVKVLGEGQERRKICGPERGLHKNLREIVTLCALAPRAQ